MSFERTSNKIFSFERQRRHSKRFAARASGWHIAPDKRDYRKLIHYPSLKQLAQMPGWSDTPRGNYVDSIAEKVFDPGVVGYDCPFIRRLHVLRSVFCSIGAEYAAGIRCENENHHRHRHWRRCGRRFRSRPRAY